MIIEFSFGNFKSFKSIQTLNMTAANISSKFKEVDKNNLLGVSDKLSLLKSKVIYGANASGKSNLIEALVAFIAIVNSSVKDEKILEQRIEPFRLSTETEKKPTFFQMLLILEGVFYRYGFEATNKTITSEWLFGTPGKKEVFFFTREQDKIVVNENKFKEGVKFSSLYTQNNNDVARSNSLFLTTVKALNGEISRKIIDYISEIMVIPGLTDNFMRSIAVDSLKDKKVKSKIVELLKIADLGIDNISKVQLTKDNLPKGAPSELFQVVEKGGKFAIVVTEHKKYNARLKPVDSAIFHIDSNESEGSKKMFELSPFILQAMEQKRTLIIDEFDARFHPLLTRKLVELFNSSVNKGAQFVVVTHDTNLLSAKLLRRDQICFVEKDKYGASSLYNLVSFKGVRNDASFEKDYVRGKYGAVPFLGDFNTVISE